MYSIIFEELNYELYLAEQELHDHLSLLSVKYNGVINESNFELVQEDVKDVVMTYINKVVTGIQNAWNKFKETINDKRYEELKNKYGKYFNSNFILKINDDDFMIPDFNQLQELLKLQPNNNLGNIIDDLESDDIFTEKYFGFVYEKGKSIKQVAEEKVLKKITADQKSVTKDSLSEYIKFLEGYKTVADSISKDINNLNSATRSVNQIMTTYSIGEMVDISKTLGNYFHEDENSQPTFSSGTPEGQKNEGREKIKDMQKKINVYFKVTTSVLSAKLSVLNKIEKICFSIVKNFVILASKENASSDSVENKKETGTPQIPQIEA